MKTKTIWKDGAFVALGAATLSMLLSAATPSDAASNAASLPYSGRTAAGRPFVRPGFSGITGSNVHVMPPMPHQYNGHKMPRRSDQSGPVTYHGGKLVLNMKVYVVFWQWGSDPYGEANYVVGMVRDLGGSSWLQNDTQYADSLGEHIKNNAGMLKGVWIDNVDPLPHDPTPVDFGPEALIAQKHFIGKYDPNAVYVIATPPGDQDPNGGDEFGVKMCSEHAWTYADQLGKKGVPYVNLPYQPDAMTYGVNCYANSVNPGNSGVLDGVGIAIGHELAEVQTDPFNFGGYWALSNDPNDPEDEIADLCVNQNLEDLDLFSGQYAVQSLYDLQSNFCNDYLPKTFDEISIGGDNSIWALGTDNYLYTHSPLGSAPNFYAVPAQGTNLAVDSNGTPFLVSQNQLYFYQTSSGLHLIDSPPASRVSVGTDNSVWMLGTAKARGGYTVYEEGGALGNYSFTALSGISATRIAAEPSGQGLAVDNKHNLRRYNPGNAGWDYVGGPQAQDVVPTANPQDVLMLAWPKVGNDYPMLGLDLATQTIAPLGFDAVNVSVGPQGDPWAVTSSGYLYHYNTWCNCFQNV